MKTSAVIIGGAIGDALGVPFEIKKADNPILKAWDGSTFYSSKFHNTEIGQWSDDTSMTMCLANSLLECNGFNRINIIKQYLKWFDGADFKGAGKNTIAVLAKLKENIPIEEAASTTSIGNGTAMRVSPIGVYYRNSIEHLIEYAKMDAELTHNTIEAKMGSVCISYGVAAILNGVEKSDIIHFIIDKIDDCKLKENLLFATELLYGKSCSREHIVNMQQLLGKSFTVVDTVARAFYVFCKTNTFDDAIRMAIYGGLDTDTVASMVGNLAGAYYGLEQIPQKWIDVLDKSNDLKRLDQLLYNGKYTV